MKNVQNSREWIFSAIWLCLVFIMAVLVSFLVTSCAPQINSFHPAEGPVGTGVTIIGENFGSTAGGNTVRFANTIATDVTLLQEDKLFAKVPAGAVTGEISVKVGNKEAISDNNFVVIDSNAAEWTFMVYIDGDNNLEDAAITDFMEMATVGSSNDINIVVQMDRRTGYNSSYGDWTGTRRFLIENGDEPDMVPISDLGEMNMGDPTVLQNFVEWGINNYHAKHYALVIWNHGGGWRRQVEDLHARAMQKRSGNEQDNAVARAVAWDDTDGDVLYMKEVQTALEGARANLERSSTSVKLDIIGFDACVMGMLEVCYAMRNVANYVVASENFEPNNGWPYNTILADLDANPTVNAADLASNIVTQYQLSYPGATSTTQSAIDISKLANLVSKIDHFADVAVTDWAAIKTARDNSRLFQYPYGFTGTYWGVDIYDFANRVQGSVSTEEIKNAASAIKTALNNCIVNELHSTDMDGSHGLSIYFPNSQTSYQNDPDFPGYEQTNTDNPVDYVKQHKWNTWLLDYFSNIP
jgi:hypothetical protein